MKNKSCHMAAFSFLIIGGLNWLMFGLFQWELGDILGGPGSWGARILYILIGLGAIHEIITHKSSCSCCGAACASHKDNTVMSSSDEESQN